MTVTRVHLREWETIPADDPRLRDLVLRDDACRLLADRLAQEKRLEVRELRSGLEISSRAYVGRVKLGDLEITVTPKVAEDDLLTLFRYAFGLDDFELRDRTGFETGDHLFQDLIAAQLLAEVGRLVRRGLAKRYVVRSERLSNPRGRIDFGRLARDVPLTEAALDCRHHHRQVDHQLNQVVMAGVGLALKICRHRETHSRLGRLARHLEEELTAIKLGITALGRAEQSVDRLTARYGPALRLTRMLLLGQCVSLADGSSVDLPGFLFDMNSFFEALIERLLSDHLIGVELVPQHGLSKMMRYDAAHNPRNASAPRPRPDFVLREGKRITGIFDAKYRDLWSTQLPRDMLYQLSIYALSQPSPFDAGILFPTEQLNAKDARVEIADPLTGRAAHGVLIRPVIIPELARVLREANPASARDFAKRLVRPAA